MYLNTQVVNRFSYLVLLQRSCSKTADVTNLLGDRSSCLGTVHSPAGTAMFRCITSVISSVFIIVIQRSSAYVKANSVVISRIKCALVNNNGFSSRRNSFGCCKSSRSGAATFRHETKLLSQSSAAIPGKFSAELFFFSRHYSCYIEYSVHNCKLV